MAMHEEALEEAMSRAILREPGMVEVIEDMYQRLRSGRYDARIVDAVFQRHDQHVTRLDAYGFMQLFCDLMVGDVAMIAFPLRDEPGPNGDLSSAVVLRRDLPSYFEVDVTYDRGRSAQSDGYIAWTVPLQFDRLEEKGSKLSKIEVKAYHAPLEIGTTAASRTLLHVREDGAVARWPYGHKELFIFWRVRGKAVSLVPVMEPL